jgi:hypothetical protein
MSDGMHDSWEHQICTMPKCCNLVSVAPWCTACRIEMDKKQVKACSPHNFQPVCRMWDVCTKCGERE